MFISIDRRCRCCGSVVYHVVGVSSCPEDVMQIRFGQSYPDRPVGFCCGYCGVMFVDPRQFFVKDVDFNDLHINAALLAPSNQIGADEVVGYIDSEACDLKKLAGAQRRASRLLRERESFLKKSGLSKLNALIKEIRRDYRLFNEL